MSIDKPLSRKYGMSAWAYMVFLRLRFHLFQRHRYNRLGLETIGGKPFVVLPGVFNPALFFSSEFFVQTFSPLLIPPGSKVLDMGTGSGVGAVFAARWAETVIGVDVNPEAVRCARMNVLLNRVEDRVEIREGDLFTPVEGERFEVILFNPPYISGTAKNDLEKAFFSTGLAQRFAEGVREHLKPGGRVLMILSDIGDETGFLEPFREKAFTMEKLAQRPLVNETITVYSLTPPPSPWPSPSGRGDNEIL